MKRKPLKPVERFTLGAIATIMAVQPALSQPTLAGFYQSRTLLAQQLSFAIQSGKHAQACRIVGSMQDLITKYEGISLLDEELQEYKEDYTNYRREVAQNAQECGRNGLLTN